jgi:hypothetical protein
MKMKILVLFFVMFGVINAQLPTFVGAWVTDTPPAHLVIPNSSVWIGEFVKPISNTVLLNKANWLITDGTVPLTIYSAEIITTLDGLSCPTTKLVAVRTSKAQYYSGYTITVTGVGTSEYFYNGYIPHRPKSTASLKKK